MSVLYDLLSKAQQLEFELNKFTQGELGEVKSLALELKQNLEVAVSHETVEPTPTPSTDGIQTSSDLT